MSTKCQLIAFIDPKKFSGLVGEHTIPGYEVGKLGRGSNYLDNFQAVVYVHEVGSTPVVGRLNQAQAGKASVILVPDACLKENFNYVPKKTFKILFHSNKGSADKIEALRENPFFLGELVSFEEADTPYDLLASAIRLKSLATDLPSVLDQVPLFDPKLEAKLELLQYVLSRKDPPRRVLDSLNAWLPRIEKDLKEFKGITTGVLSPEYQVAYSKLLDLLEIQ